MKQDKRYYVYIMASRPSTLSTGVTGDIYHRAFEHKPGEIESFTKQYPINRLVYYGTFKDVTNAMVCEKQIKYSIRAKRLALIRAMNPTWQDLAEGWGEALKLEIPRFARDDSSIERQDQKPIAQAISNNRPLATDH